MTTTNDSDDAKRSDSSDSSKINQSQGAWIAWGGGEGIHF